MDIATYGYQLSDPIVD